MSNSTLDSVLPRVNNVSGFHPNIERLVKNTTGSDLKRCAENDTSVQGRFLRQEEAVRLMGS
jgi:hypothetical protein